VNFVNKFWIGYCMGRPGRGASQVEKSSRLNKVTQILTAAYDGACYLNISVRMT